jgi:PBP1b-binding outer membrane lipoprotein LpoB
MKKLSTIYKTILFASVILAGCAQEKGNTETNSTNTTTTASKAFSFESPCELITLDVVKSYIAIPDGIDVVSEDKMLTYPTCSFQWKDGVRKESQTIGTTVVTYDLESKVMIVLVKNVNSSMFDRSTSVYKNPEELSGLGERAVWGDNMNQLTFLSKEVMMHVHVHVDNDKSINRKHAIELTKHLLKGL